MDTSKRREEAMLRRQQIDEERRERLNERLTKLEQIKIDRDNCHDRLDGIVPRKSNSGETHTLLGRLEILIAAIEFCAGKHEEPNLRDQVIEYRKSRSCPPAHALKHRYQQE